MTGYGKLYALSLLMLVIAFAEGESLGDVFYVSPSGSDTIPYADWSTSATNIDLALAQASDGDAVKVSNGTYYVGARLIVSNSVTVSSVNGPFVTTVDGSFTARCFEIIHTGAVVSGFTLRNGRTPNDGNGGGGARVVHGRLNRCVVRNNAVLTFGTGGGGVYCTSNGVVENCLIRNNSSTWWGAGVSCGEGGTIRNCTIVYNSGADWGDGLVYRSQKTIIENTIIYHNGDSNFDYPLFHTAPRFDNCCIYPMPSNTLNTITNEPLFVSGEYRLSDVSPCIDRGTNIAYASGEQDIQGYPRVVNGTADMGAFEALWVTGKMIEETGSFNTVWGSMPGASYQLECCTNLYPQLWTPVGSVVTSGVAPVQIPDTNMFSGLGIYRVRCTIAE